MLLAPLLAWLGYSKLTEGEGESAGIPGVPSSSFKSPNAALLVAGAVGLFFVGKSQRWW